MIITKNKTGKTLHASRFQQFLERQIQMPMHLIRDMFNFSRADLFKSLQITFAVMMPIVIAQIAGQSELGIICFLAALYAILADVGGAYRARALSMGIATIWMALGSLIATLAGTIPWLAVLVVVLWSFAGGMMAVYGNGGVKFSYVVIVIFMAMIDLAQPSTTLDLQYSLVYLLGGAWAMLVMLILWPFHPYRPVRAAIADYYRSLGNFLTQISQASTEQEARPVLGTRQQLAEAHDHAHSIVMSTRSRRFGTHPTGRQLLLLTIQGDQLYNSAVALSEHIYSAVQHEHFAHVQAHIQTAMSAVIQVLNELATTMTNETRKLDRKHIQTAQQILAQEEAALRVLLHQSRKDDATYSALTNLRNLQSTLRTMSKTVEGMGNGVYQLNTHQPGELRTLAPATLEFAEQRSLFQIGKEKLALLKDNLTPRSVVFRYALRLAISLGAAVSVTHALHTIHGFWVSLTIISVLNKPEISGTHKRALQRVMGTILGGILAAFLVLVLQDQLALLVLMFVLSVFTFAHLTGNYRTFVFFLTPLVIALFDLQSIGNWQLALLRVFNTLVGGGIALLAGYLFWPQWERERLPQQLARTINANRQFFHAVMQVYQAKNTVQGMLRRARQYAHLENSNAAVAFQRLLGEPRNQQGDVERFHALVVYNQHLNDNITALAEQSTTLSGHNKLPELARFANEAESLLHEVEKAVRTDQHTIQKLSLDESLQEVQAALQQITAMRTQALNTSNLADSAYSEAVRDFAPINAQLDHLAQDVTGMYELQAAN
jgi:uncharacterized membrane protein YccC